MAATSQISSLYDPFSEGELKGDDTNLAEKDKPIPTFTNKGTPLISVLLATTAVMICLTIYLGFFYELGFSRAKISKTTDLTDAGDTAAQAEITRQVEKDTLSIKMAGDLETAGYVIGGLAIVSALIIFGFFWYWKGVAEPELTRENIIGRDLASAMNTGKSLDNVASLLAYHVHPSDKTSKVDLQCQLKTNMALAMDMEILYPSRIARRLRGASADPNLI